MRQEANPLPYFAPTTNPAFFISGITTMQTDFASRSLGMPLSGAAMISLTVLVDSSNRWASDSPAHRASELKTINVKVFWNMNLVLSEA